MLKHHLEMVVSFLLAASLAGCSGASNSTLPTTNTSFAAGVPVTQQNNDTNTVALNEQSTVRAPQGSNSTGGYFGIDAGGGSAGHFGNDSGTGGWTSVVTDPIDVSHVSNAAPQSVYQSQRTGSTLKYVIANRTPNAKYTVKLHFVESFFHAAGARQFSVAINGTQVLSKFDIFAAAGGANIAVARSFNVAADASGQLAINFSADVNNASVAAVEGWPVVTSGSPAPAPSSAPTAEPTATPTTAPTTQYPIYSNYFTGNTPFHHTVASLMSAGATVLSPTIAQHYWAQGVGSDAPATQTGGVGPLYMAAEGQPGYTFTCPTWGACNANGLVAHFPSNAYAQTGTDHHLNSFDPVYLHGEIDGWGGDGNPNHACNLASGSPGKATCSWGGFYPFDGTGLAKSGNSGDAGGYAFGLMNITAQELLQGHIDHALGIQESCLDDGGVYPSTVGRTSDAHCPANLEPTAKYGQMIHLKSSVNVASLGYSQYCRVIVQALQTYGAYTADNNGSWGLALNMEYMNSYAGTNPWFTTIFPSMVAGGDGSGSAQNFHFGTCLQRIPASDIEVIQISSKLPAM